MIKAFVFGKFLPFHKGHQAMIDFALSKCDFLTVLVCCSNKESVSCNIRKQWIKETFPDERKIEIRVFNYNERELPNTSASSKQVSKVWAEMFMKILPGYSLLITSEKYGDYVAEFMGIRHQLFDIQREKQPVSATALQKDLFTNWKYLPKSVKPYFAIKAVLLGTESTGKTTLTEKLSKHFNCSKVLEAGRDLIEDSNTFSMDDLYLVAKEHAKRIDNAVVGNSPLVIIDTDIYITKSYCHFMFNKELAVDKTILKSNKAHLYLYLNNDVEFVQDRTRLSESDRNLLDASHRRTLKDNKIEIVEISGNWEERFEKAATAVNQLIKTLNGISHK